MVGILLLGSSGCIDKEKKALKEELDRMNGLVGQKQREVEEIQRALASIPMQTKHVIWKASELTALEQQLVGLEEEIERWKVQKLESEAKQQEEQKKIDDYRNRYVNS